MSRPFRHGESGIRARRIRHWGHRGRARRDAVRVGGYGRAMSYRELRAPPALAGLAECGWVDTATRRRRRTRCCPTAAWTWCGRARSCWSPGPTPWRTPAAAHARRHGRGPALPAGCAAVPAGCARRAAAQPARRARRAAARPARDGAGPAGGGRGGGLGPRRARRPAAGRSAGPFGRRAAPRARPRPADGPVDGEASRTPLGGRHRGRTRSRAGRGDRRRRTDRSPLSPTRSAARRARVHRRCLAAFGYGPATLRRVLRFRRAAALLAGGRVACRGRRPRRATPTSRTCPARPGR